MGSIRQLNLEFPMAFVQALQSGECNTHVMLLDAHFKDNTPCSLVGWRTNETVYLVISEKDGSELSLEVTDQGGISCCVQSGLTEKAEPEPQQLLVEHSAEVDNWAQLLDVADSAEAEEMPSTVEDEIEYEEEKLNEEGSTFMCPDPQCSRGFQSFKQLKNHVKYRCHKDQYNIKELLCAVEDVEPYVPERNGLRVVCPYCQRERPATFAVIRHMEIWHSNQTDFDETLKQVKEAMGSSRREHKNLNIKQRRRLMQADPKNAMSCPHCHKVFNLRSLWNKHIKNWCRKNPNRKRFYKCPHCSYCTISMEKYDQHLKNHTEESFPFECDECHQRFATANGLGKHVRCLHDGADLNALLKKTSAAAATSKSAPEDEIREEFRQEETSIGSNIESENDKARVFPCPVKQCTMVFSRFHTLSQHVRSTCFMNAEESFHELMCKLEEMEPKERMGKVRHTCPLCKRIRPGCSLLRHLLVWHSEEDGYEEALSDCRRLILLKQTDVARMIRMAQNQKEGSVDQTSETVERLTDEEEDDQTGEPSPMSCDTNEVKTKSEADNEGRKKLKLTKVKDPKLTCPADDCFKTFSQFKELSHHVRYTHASLENYHELRCILEDLEPYTSRFAFVKNPKFGFAMVSCPLCPRVRPGKAILKHMNIWHSREDGYEVALEKCHKDIDIARRELRAKRHRSNRMRRQGYSQKKQQAEPEDPDVSPNFDTNDDIGCETNENKGAEISTDVMHADSPVQKSERVFECPATGCDCKFFYFEPYARHVRKAHKECCNYQELLCIVEDVEPRDTTGRTLFVCWMCGRVRPGTEAILNHLEIWHKNDRGYDYALERCMKDMTRAKQHFTDTKRNTEKYKLKTEEPASGDHDAMPGREAPKKEEEEPMQQEEVELEEESEEEEREEEEVVEQEEGVAEEDGAVVEVKQESIELEAIECDVQEIEDGIRDQEMKILTMDPETGGIVRSFICPAKDCGLVYKNFSKFSRHVRSAHKKSDNFHELCCILEDMEPLDRFGYTRNVCPVCQRVRPGKSILKHVRVWHSQEPNYKKILNKCIADIQRSHLDLRSEQHKRRSQLLKKAKNKFHCSFCDKAFESNIYCIRHVKHWCQKNPDRTKIYICNKCKFQSIHESSVINHRIEVHGEKIREFKCDLCDMTYRSFAALNIHKRKAHEDDVKQEIPSSYMCELCGVISNTEVEHKVHLHSHSTNHTYICQLCAAEYKGRISLKDHILRKHDGAFPVICPKCKIGVESDDAFDTHKCVPVEPTAQCHICQATFQAPEALKRHIDNIHHNIYRLHCDDCGLGFNEKKKLEKHTCSRALRRRDSHLHIKSEGESEQPSVKGDHCYGYEERQFSQSTQVTPSKVIVIRPTQQPMDDSFFSS